MTNGILVPGTNGRIHKLPWPRITVAVLMERTIGEAAFLGFLRIAQRGHPFSYLPHLRTDMARNKYAKSLLDSNFTHLLMLDIDHVHPPDIVERLGRWVKEDPSRWVVGGLNYRRGEPYDPCAMVKGADGAFYAIAEWPKNQLLRVDILGTGCILIDRRVFEKMPPPWFYYDYSGVVDDHWPTEDVGFSLKCAEYSINLWCDTGTTSPHVIEGFVDERAFREHMARHNIVAVDIPQGVIP